MNRRSPRATARLSAVAIAAALATFAGVAESQQPAGASAPLPTRPPGYTVDSAGHPVLSGSGSCVRTSQWVMANSVDPCDQVARVSVPVPVVTYQEKPAPPPAPVAVVAPPEPPRTVIQKVTLSTDVLFDFNKAELKEQGKVRLEEFAGQVRGAKIEEITIVGHADRIGSEAFNEKLSAQRAEAVKAHLAGLGANVSVITAQGKGETQPVTGDQCKKMAGKKLIECLQPDRRVEIEVLGSREVAGTAAPATGGTR